MKITSGRLLAASTVAFAAAAFATPAAAQKIENSYICVFQPGLVAKANVKAEANRSANAAGGSVKFTYQNTIRGFAVNASAQGVAKMQAKNPRIAYCEQDQVMSTEQRGGPKSGGGGTDRGRRAGIPASDPRRRVSAPAPRAGSGRRADRCH